MQGAATNSTDTANSTVTWPGLGTNEEADARTAWLAHCQQQGYRDASTAASSKDVANTSSSPLHLDCNLKGSGLASYTEQQCAEGFTSTLCAACLPGFYGTLDFECKECPRLAQTISLGVLGFAGTSALVLYTTYSNLGSNLETDEADHSVQVPDVLKVGEGMPSTAQWNAWYWMRFGHHTDVHCPAGCHHPFAVSAGSWWTLTRACACADLSDHACSREHAVHPVPVATRDASRNAAACTACVQVLHHPVALTATVSAHHHESHVCLQHDHGWEAP
jgi:hypothetical protein